MSKKKKRLDLVLQERLSKLSRNQIASFIIQGKVKIDGQPVTKPGILIDEDTPIDCDMEKPKFVCRAGFKLEQALDEFNIDVTDFVVMDAGLSTGGFTDCLLQRGAKKVYGVDVGYGQVHENIRVDERVVVMERVNLRHLDALPELVDLVTLDLSFISVLKVMSVVTSLLKPQGKLVVLIKPQFEAERSQVGRGGIIKDPKVHQQVTDLVVAGIKEFGFELQGVTDSPITGTHGNKEFLAYFVKS
ncbi:TlyA family RNA methyltransferase [bacterium]|jgi:23S rRNA (cytidine1920-2'-O)/16S rRNA (cytidine1409-2'-O)-methyltransferase|nr:TlyA family RNA methyltransferase [bacterium]MBT5015339.1 TlyA family RNA methyltransferase [bacterium]